MAAMQQVVDEVVDKVILNDEQPLEQPQLNNDERFKLIELMKKKTCLWLNEKAGNKDNKQTRKVALKVGSCNTIFEVCRHVFLQLLFLFKPVNQGLQIYFRFAYSFVRICFFSFFLVF